MPTLHIEKFQALPVREQEQLLLRILSRVSLFYASPQREDIVFHSATKDDPISGVVRTLEKDGAQSVLEAGNHRAFSVCPAPISHYDQADPLLSSVVWLVEKNGGDQIAGWHPNYWQRLLADNDFIQKFEMWLRNIIDNSSERTMAYIAMGNRVESKLSLSQRQALNLNKNGMQSIPWPHFHIFELPITLLKLAKIFDDHANGEHNHILLRANEHRHRRLLAYLLNFSGELAIKHYDRYSRLQVFGRRINYTQSMGNIELPRTMFSFSSLHDALHASVTLREQVAKTWLAFATELLQNQLALESLQISPVPTMVIALLPKQQQKPPFDKDRPWVVVPFPVVPLQWTFNGNTVPHVVDRVIK